jgi:hypothetical protein
MKYRILLILFAYLLINYLDLSLLQTIYCQGDDDKGSLFNPTIKHTIKHSADKSLINNVKDGITDSAAVVGEAIKQGSDKIGNALVTGSLAGATAYAVKNANIPPVAKAATIVGATTLGTAMNAGLNLVTKLDINPNPTSGHPESPTDENISGFSPSSPFEQFDIFNLFGVDPNNHLLGLVFIIFIINLLILFFVYLLIMHIIYIYLNKENLELKWVDKVFPINYSNKFKAFIKKFLQR